MKKLLLCIVGTFLASSQLGFAEDAFIREFEDTYPNHKIELMLQKSLDQESKAILFLHGAQDLGLKSISQTHLNYWLGKGYAVAAVSMPGFGESTGERDFCGPFTIDSLNLVINRIKEELSASELAIMGFEPGGLAAILLSAHRNDISCIICTNGGYDLLRHKVPNDQLMSILEQKRYKLDCNDEVALIDRSPIYHISDIATPIFLLHRKGHPVVNEKEAMDFYEAMLAAGKECHLVIKDRNPGSDEQKLSYEEILTETESWLDNIMKSK